MPGDLKQIETAIKTFLLDRVLSGEDPEKLSSDVPLMTSGILDSVAMLKLVSFIEDQFRVEIQPHEVDEEHFDTVARIVALIGRKL